MQRKDDFEERRKHLANLTEEELKDKFWELAEQVVKPLIELAKTHTSPSIERSVLLRMGFDSLAAKAIVDKCVKMNILGKGAGNVVLKYSLFKNIPLEQAGKELASGRGWDEIKEALMIDISNPEIFGNILSEEIQK